MLEAMVRVVDEPLLARARALAAGAAVTVPRHSATVVLLRDPPGPAETAAGPEAYLLRRRATMAFAPGQYAFPGGSVDRRDVAEPPAWAGPSPGWWARRFGLADERLAQALVCAAVRETFEESGVLLAGPSPDTVVGDTTGDADEADRMALVGRALSFGQFLARRRLVLRSDLLAPWAHWVTPRVQDRRFDTRFFLAALPPGQRTRDVSGEADRVGWQTPAAALASLRRGELRMLPPTYATVASLQPFATVADALAAAARREIAPVMPEVLLDEGGDGGRWVLPGEPGHSGACDRGEVR